MIDEAVREIKRIEAELLAQKKEDREAFIDPPEKYRVVKVGGANAGYVAQYGAVKQDCYRVYTDDIPIRDSIQMLEQHHQLVAEGVWKPETYWGWYNIQPGKTFDTYEAAEEWLRNWLRPEVEEVYFDGYGKRITKENESSK